MTVGDATGQPQMLQTISDGQRFVHRDLWQVVVGQLDQAKKDKSGSFYNHLVAMVFAFHALEAYVNFIIEKLRPEMLEFRRGRFPSFNEKLQEVLAQLGMEEPDATSRPYSTVRELKELRDKIAHGRREVIKWKRLHPVTEEPPRDPGFLASSVTPEKAVVAAQDVERFAELIHDAARLKLPADVSLKQKALLGILQITSRTTTAAP